MTYIEAQESVGNSRTTLQAVNARTEILTMDTASALEQAGGLISQIPPEPLGGYTEEPKEGFVQEVNDYAALAASLSARIPE